MIRPSPLQERIRHIAAEQGLAGGPRVFRYSGRINPRLMKAAEEATGLSGSPLIEFALQKLAVKDPFWAHDSKFHGVIDKDVDLEF